MTSSERLLKLFPKDGPTWDLNSRAAYKLALVHHQHVPELRRAEEAGQGQHGALSADLCRIQAILPDESLRQIKEGVHVLACRHSATCSGILLARGSLLLPRQIATAPEMLHGVTGAALEVGKLKTHFLECLSINFSSAALKQ